ncbi:Acylphosphatase [Daedalea quercina L-15889]|uniref:Acylphosphatase n=1 Tax=Daedalea quercina L-15889 TaxID=1314783 RepID=A0A165SSI0_9APHY|nr:Acylphosphatase [Daedalea quercina L-15889]
MAYHAFNFIVSGRVQGVNFRAFTKGIAHDTGVVGWVANDTAGHVVGEAQGSESTLDRFKKALHIGPPHATVRGVELSNERTLEQLEYEAFAVRR